MIDVYLVPIGSKYAVNNMNTSLLRTVSRKKVVEHGAALPESLDGENQINVWGLAPGPANTRQWEKFEQHDIVIFVPTNSDLIVTEIEGKCRNKSLATDLWDMGENGEKWELIFFVKIVGTIGLSKRSFLNEFDYPEKDKLQGNRRITDRFFSRYNTVQDFLNLYR